MLLLAAVCGGLIGLALPARGETLSTFGMSMPGGPEFFVLGFVVIGIGGTILWIIGLVDVLRNTRLEGNDRIIWVLVVVLLQALGAILYFCLAPRHGRSS
jgi:hypothetical protein